MCVCVCVSEYVCVCEEEGGGGVCTRVDQSCLDANSLWFVGGAFIRRPTHPHPPNQRIGPPLNNLPDVVPAACGINMHKPTH
jgi:hypothetical protein